jgi:hypothetical protein
VSTQAGTLASGAGRQSVQQPARKEMPMQVLSSSRARAIRRAEALLAGLLSEVEAVGRTA